MLKRLTKYNKFSFISCKYNIINVRIHVTSLKLQSCHKEMEDALIVYILTHQLIALISQSVRYLMILISNL